MLVPVTLEERYWYPTDGGQVWVAGYQLVADDGRFIGREEAARRGLHVLNVAGAQHHDDVLQAAEIGVSLDLRRDAGNPHDPNAIAVLTRDGGHLGFVPREAAAELAPRLDAGERFCAVLLRERRASPRDPRTGVSMLVAAAEALELRIA